MKAASEALALKAPASRTGLREGWQRLARNRLAVVGLVVLALLGGLALLAPLLPLADPNATDPSNRLLRPFTDSAHLLGTDALGRDLLSRLIWGLRVSLAVGIAATLVAAVVGSLIGLLAAWFGRWTDMALMRGIDVVMAFPYLLLALAIVAVLGPGLLNALFAIAIVNIPFFARAVRGSTLSLIERDFIEAARKSGYSHARILFSELLPNVLPVIIITMSTTLGWMILETAGLSFLGLGAQPPQADLGSMLGEGRRLLMNAPHVAALPGLAILVLVVAINLVGDGLRDLLDPRLRSGALSRPLAATASDAPAKRAAAGGEALVAHACEQPLLGVRQLRTHFLAGQRTLRAVDDVSFDIAPGAALGIVGESGSGKSVTALSMLGLVATPPGRIVGGRIDYHGGGQGAVDLVGTPLARLQAIRGNRIAYIFQDPQTTLNPLMRIGDQVAETVWQHRGCSWQQARARALELLEEVRIPDAAHRMRAWPHELSGGQRQRVVIAMALANEPDLLIADEPTTALDVTTQAQVLDLLDALRRRHNAALLFISHDFAVVAQLCDQVQVMYAGRIVEAGPAAELFATPHHPYTERLLACVPELGQPERVMEAIPGLPPAVDDLPPGCAFAPRCHLATEACQSAPIALQAIAPGRLVRCIRHAEVGRG